jgi:hypothetical protein
MLAALTKVRELELDKSEAEKLAKSIANVARHYHVPGIAQKTKDWIMLMQTIGVLYVPRVIAYNIRTAAAKPAPTPATTAIAVGIGAGTGQPRPQPQSPKSNGNGPAPVFETVMTPQGPASVRIR